MGSGAVCEMNIGCKTRSWEAREEAGMRVQVRAKLGGLGPAGSERGPDLGKETGRSGQDWSLMMSEGEGGGRVLVLHNRTDSDGNRDASVPLL